MLNTTDPRLSDGTALETREQDPSQAVADRCPEPTLERFGDEQAVSVSQCFLVGHHPAGQFQSTPTNPHRGTSPVASCRCPIPGATVPWPEFPGDPNSDLSPASRQRATGVITRVASLEDDIRCEATGSRPQSL